MYFYGVIKKQWIKMTDMKTPYLDDAIKRYEKALKANMLSDGGKEALIEFKAIKKALRIHDVVGRSEQFKCEKCGSDWGEVCATCFNCNHESEDLST